MKRTLVAGFIFFAFLTLIFIGSSTVEKRSDALIKDIEDVIAMEGEDLAKKDKAVEKIIREYEKNKFIFAGVMGHAQFDEISNQLKMARVELKLSPNEEFIRTLYNVKLRLNEIGEQENILPDNLI